MTDPWDDLQYGGSVFNWITPGFALLQDLLAGPVAHFGVVATGGWYRRDIRRLLNKRGITNWGFVYTLDFETLSFSVYKRDAKRAHAVLKEAGVPLDSVPQAAVENKHRGWFE